MFLMHRVELKADTLRENLNALSKNVPNAPCGVESIVNRMHHWAMAGVPNAPCGVERGLRSILETI